MSIRTYLAISYLALLLLLTFGMLVVANQSMDRMRDRNLAFTEDGAMKLTRANYQLAKQILTEHGEYVVKDKAEDVAKELAFLLKGKKTFDYAKIRRDPVLRKVAIQPIYTPAGSAGYTDLYDKKGYILFHPDPQVEGQDQGNPEWQAKYPETWELIKRSLTEDQVFGYFSFFDKHGQTRQRYSARVHVPGTPFIVGAIVNIDEYFRPTQVKMKAASVEMVAESKRRIREHAAAASRQVKVAGFIGGGVFCLIAGIFGLWFAGSISRPILNLRDGVREVGEGNFSVAVPVKGAKEIVHLAQSFNLLGQQLIEYIEKRDFIRDTFGRYVTQEVVKKLLEDKSALEMGGEIREVTILMSDLRGFTALIADMDPEAVIIWLNRYLGKMIEILLDNRAVIDEIVGDGILAFFGAPTPMEDHPARAVACALQMQAAMTEINEINAKDGLPYLEMGIAVNTGQVVVGNIGSERRTKYSVIGSHVNFTARVEGFAVGGQVLISTPTYERLTDLVEVGDTLHAEMKGVPGTATIYEVLGLKGDYNLHLEAKSDTLVPLPDKINVQLQRIREKIVATAGGRAWITQLSETAAVISCEGEMEQWEDVRLHRVDETGQELPGKAYGKVAQLKPAGDNLSEALIRFTSLSPEFHQMIRQAVGKE
jgi:class 3 adenylate cyclase